ncbi:MAG: type II toxin-antitoxin system VapC family toxin [Gammaproteobacteria bacterium]|nr:type II toxin-antitoxin system VapC family toxin [Gammaproteobacteria bacterium]
MYLLDTNILSEIRKIKQNRANENVVNWLANVLPTELYTNVVVLMEIEKGIVRLRRKDSQQADNLAAWYQTIKPTFQNRIYSIDEKTASICATLHSPNPAPANDAWIAATAIQHNLVLATRNTNDFNFQGLQVFNPFEYQAKYK